MSVIARHRACVRTVQNRHSEVMKSVGRSHIQRCVRAAVAQAMYDPCYYVVTGLHSDPLTAQNESNAKSNVDVSTHRRRQQFDSVSVQADQVEADRPLDVTRDLYTDTARANADREARVRWSLTKVLTVRCC